MKCACTLRWGAPATFSESCACPTFRCKKFAEPTRYETCNIRVGLQSAMEALQEALLQEQRASFMEHLSRQHLWAYLPQPFCPVWQFLQLQVQWSHDSTTFFIKEIRKGSMSPTRPSATPTSCTWIGHAYVDRAHFFQVHALVEHISSRSTACLHKTERERTRYILQSSL